MTIGTILLAVALFILVAVFVLRPILTERFRPIKTDEIATLTGQKTQIVDGIRALQFDFETGKVPEDQFHVERERLVVEAAGILQQIDELPDPDAEIEQAVQNIKNGQLA